VLFVDSYLIGYGKNVHWSWIRLFQSKVISQNRNWASVKQIRICLFALCLLCSILRPLWNLMKP